MAILSVQDLAVYAPNLDLDSPQTAILKAQMLAEGPNGSNRPLEKQPYTETPLVSSDGIIRLSRWPIDETEDVVVQIRGPRNSSRVSNLYDWTVLDPTNYSVDYELFEITVDSILGGVSSDFSLTGNSNYGIANVGYRNRSSVRRTQNSSVKVTYTAGFDFLANPLDPRAQLLKMALASVLDIQNSSLSTGVKQFNVSDFMSGTRGADLIQQSVSSHGRTVMQEYLDIFKQFCPREYAV